MTTFIAIPQLPPALTLVGTEQLELVQSDVSCRTTVNQIAALAPGNTFTQAGAGAVTRTTSSKLQETVSVLDFGGVMGGPAAANTVALQAAIATGKMVHIPSGTYAINPVSFTSNVRLCGEGDTSILQWASGVDAVQLIFVSGAGVSIELRDMTVDGNFATFTPNTTYHSTIRYEPIAIGASTRISVHNCQFIGGREFDVWTFGSLTVDAWVKAEFIGCRFRDGQDGSDLTNTVCIGTNDDVDLLVVGCTFDGPPVSDWGRVGIRQQQSSKLVSQQPGSVVVSGNTFRNMGYDQANALGAIEVYSGASQVSVTGNRVIGPRGRGISVKASASDVAITGNVVKGLTGDTAAIAGACIVAFSSQALGTAGKRMTITGNTCEGTGAGIFIDGADFATSPDTPAFEDVIIASNAIMVSTYGISFRYVNGVKVSGNTIRGGTYGVAMLSNNGETLTIADNDIRECSIIGILTLATAFALDVAILDNYIAGCTSFGIRITNELNSFQIKGNTIKDGASGGVSIAAAPVKMSVIQGNTGIDNSFAYAIPNSALVVEINNVWEPSQGFTSRLVTIASGAIIVTGELHYVETEGGAGTDDLVTINGGRQNQIMVLYAANSAHDVVLKDGGGNLFLAGDFTLTNAADSITLQRNGTNWVELARSDNAA